MFPPPTYVGVRTQPYTFSGLRAARLLCPGFFVEAELGTIGYTACVNHGQVKLGLLPGWGGTQLLHPVVGLQAALDMILTGEPRSLD